MIELTNIVKTFKTHGMTVEALKGVSLKVEKSDIFGVVGYSGAGKSTLIRCINLLEKPDSGSVMVNGEELTGLDEKDLERHRQKIGMIFQHFNLLRSKTVYGNIALPLEYQKKPAAEIGKRVDELLNLVGLEDKKYAYPSELSGGQKQRVAIARALANDPQILLSDEATSALDPQMTESILELLYELNQKLGLTIVVITHEMLVIKEICNKMAVMENGKIVETGELYNIFSNPQAELTRDFTAGLLKLDGLQKLIKQSDFHKVIGSDGQLFHFIFTGDRANEPFISRIVHNFSVEASIIYGCTEVIQGKPLGSLFVILRGDDSAVQQSIAYLVSNGVSVKKVLDGNSEIPITGAAV
ncbi:methionine import ATP-binding protein MetN 1 [Spirochaetia bacterium]|nr:methionine import ATP-binding protein MetN 1 [Spirochaetia bacterium]